MQPAHRTPEQRWFQSIEVNQNKNLSEPTKARALLLPLQGEGRDGDGF